MGLRVPDRWKLRAKRLARRTVSVAMALYENDAPQKASAMAFWLFLGLVPLVAILGWALARFAGAEMRQTIVGSLLSVTPAPAAHLVDEHLRRLVEQGQALAPFSILGFLWIAAGGTHTAMSSIQVSQTGQSRPWWINRVLSLVVVLGFVAVVTVSTPLLLMATPSLRWILTKGHLEQGWVQLARYGTLPTCVFLTAFGAALFYSLSTYRPGPKSKKRIWPGAWVSAVGWVTVSWGFSLYASTFARYPFFYGSLATVALLLIWLWLSSFILLVGSEVNLQLDGMRKTIIPSLSQFSLPSFSARKTPTPAKNN